MTVHVVTHSEGVPKMYYVQTQTNGIYYLFEGETFWDTSVYATLEEVAGYYNKTEQIIETPIEELPQKIQHLVYELFLSL